MTPSDLDRLVVAEAPLVRIRLKHAEDALNDYRWRRDPELAAFDASTPSTTSFAEFLAQLEQELAFPDPCRRMYALVEPGGQQIGNVMWYNAPADRQSAEIGISIGEPSFRERGVGTQAMVAFLRYLWDAHPFRVLYLHTLEWNERASRCFRRVGFQEVARIRRGDHDFVMMETRREWWLMWDAEGRFAFDQSALAHTAREADRAG